MTNPYTVVELLNRGPSIVGMSRNQFATGNHDRDKCISIDFDNVGSSEITKVFKGLQGQITSDPLCPLIGVYGPRVGGASALQYQPFVETTQQIVFAVKRARVSYFIAVGGSEVSTSPEKGMKRSAGPGNGRCSTVVDSLIRKPSIHGRKPTSSRVPRAYPTAGDAKQESQVNEVDQ